ncbi:hypothetical protein [Haemophilus influenzae]|uniref:Uncharacterized protein n=1 Tax=Haemophilus influenzae TaxID=727 RepID=A0AB37B1C9_HAEIF|nr:hypothetical protein [Haemophilus influenzae]PRJ24806.1 hypothetical protein BV056_00006 [Haemophilus influenzae]PRM84106.1 hypothetical protein BV055_00334 [Haemophilus influenzae]
MKNLSKVALAVLASVSLSACLSNSKHDNNSAELVSQYSKTEQGQKDIEAIKANTTSGLAKKTKEEVKAVKEGELITASKNAAADGNQLAQVGVFRTKDGVRYSVVTTETNKLDAATALATLSAKNEKGDDYKNPKLEAHYTGKLVYSAKSDKEPDVKIADLQLDLHNDKIGGHANDSDSDRDFYFKPATVYNNGGELAYTGVVRVETGKSAADIKEETGRYNGFFGGEAAANGKYAEDNVSYLKETAGKVDTPSFTGAYDAKK